MSVESRSFTISDQMAPGILATGSYLPDFVLTNSQVVASLDVTAEWVEDRTGIRERRIAGVDEATSDLATRAARRALATAGVQPADVGLVILATSTPDMPLPATACQVQANLGASAACAMDLDAVCTGFVYALDVAQKMMLCDDHLRFAVVIGADTYSRIVDYRDRQTCVLFGDGAGAVVLGRGADAARIEYTHLGSDGGKADYVRIPAGGSRSPATVSSVFSGDHFFKMEGRLVREFAQERLPRMVTDAAAACGLTLSEIDLLVPHQANVRLLYEVAKDLGFLPDRLAITADRYGNTGAASVPITLDHAVRAGRVVAGNRVLLAAFGGGMTWGTALVRWSTSAAGEPA